MDEKLKIKLLTWLQALDMSVKTMKELQRISGEVEEFFKSHEKVNEELPRETPPEPRIDAKRLDRIWRFLQGHIEPPMYAELRAWAVADFNYSYYTSGQKYPVDLKAAICNRLKDFTDEQLTGLEKILEARE